MIILLIYREVSYFSQQILQVLADLSTRYTTSMQLYYFLQRLPHSV